MRNAPSRLALATVATTFSILLISLANPAMAQQRPEEVKTPRPQIMVGTAVHSEAASRLRDVSWAGYRQGVDLARTLSAGIALSKTSDRLDLGVTVEAEQPVVRLAYHF